MKIKKNKIKRVLFEIKKGLRRIYWYNYTKFKYFYYTIKSKNSNISKNRISLLLPSRERSKKFYRMVSSLIDTCTDHDRIELLILLDSDDKEIELYKKIINDLNNKIYIKIFIYNTSTHAKRNNYLAHRATGEILFPINDDIIFKSKNWDKIIDYEFSKIIEEPLCLWINSGQKYNYLHCDFPIVNRLWFKRLGYIASEFFNFWYLDTWICDLCFKSKKFLITNKIKIYQFSAHTIKEEVDNTHLKNIKDDIPSKDFLIWNKTENNRKKDYKLLL